MAMGRRIAGLFALAAVWIAFQPVAAAEDPAPGVVTITLKDGGTLVGTIVAEDETAVTLRTRSGVELRLPREAIASGGTGMEAIPTPPTSRLGDPNESRLMFAPTGRPLGTGNGYFSDHYVVFPGFAVGLTPNLSLSGGVSTIPALGLSEQIFYLSASAGWKLGDKAALAIGGFATSGLHPEESFGATALFGVASFGPSDRSLSVGLALLALREEEYTYDSNGDYRSTETHWRFRDAPVVMVGGSLRVARSLSLISESWLFPGKDFELSQQPFGLALRFFNGRISADVGVVLVAEILDEGFPVPWLSFSYHFGPARRASEPKRRCGAAGRGAGRAGRTIMAPCPSPLPCSPPLLIAPAVAP